MGELNGKVALVTGASRGIGRTIAMQLAAAGVTVGVNYRTSVAEANEVVRQIAAAGGTAVALNADVSDPEAAAKLVAETEERLGSIGILVNNAGVNPRKPLDQLAYARLG